VDEERGVALRNAVQPPQAPSPVSFERLVLPSEPGSETFVEVREQLPQLRWIEAPVILPPPLKDRIEYSGYISQRKRRVLWQAPAPYPLPHARERLRTNCGKEAREELSPTILRHAWSEGEAKEGEVDLRMCPASIAVLAVNHLGFLRVCHRAVNTPQLWASKIP